MFPSSLSPKHYQASGRLSTMTYLVKKRRNKGSNTKVKSGLYLEFQFLKLDRALEMGGWRGEWWVGGWWCLYSSMNGHNASKLCT